MTDETDEERPDLGGLPSGPAFNLERDYRPLFAEAGCDFNVWVGKTAMGADVNPTEQTAGRMWGATVRYAKRVGISSKPATPVMTIEEAEAEMRRRLDNLLRERPWEKAKRSKRAHS